MKNKIVTLLCIIAILITTAIVSFADRQAYSIGKSQERAVSEISQNIWTYDENGNYVEAGPGDLIYPVVNNYGAVDRIVTVTNQSGVDVYVRTVFAFEAGDLEIGEFHDLMYILLNHMYKGSYHHVYQGKAQSAQ